MRHKRLVFTALVLALTCTTAAARAADDVKLIPRELLISYPERSSPKISPDGRKLAYLAFEQGVMNVWVRTLGRNDDRRITDEKNRGIEVFFWQQDSEHILFRQDQGGDENWHIFQANINTKRTRDLTPWPGVQARIVSVKPDFPDELLVALNKRDKSFFDVYRVNLKTGELRLDTENPGDVVAWMTDKRMRVRVAQAALPDAGTEIRVRDGEGSAWRAVKRWGAEETAGSLLDFTADGRSIWMISSLDANAARLVQMNLATGEMKAAAEDAQYDVSAALIHPHRHTPQAVQFTKARVEWVTLDPALKRDFELLGAAREGDLSVVSRDREDARWVVSYLKDDAPAYYYVYDRAARKVTPLFGERPKLEAYRLAKTRPVSFRARDGMTIHGYLTLPAGAAPRRLPTVLFVHGGPWLRDTWGFNLVVQWLANRGYAVLQINFRGSTGYGKTYRNAGDREWAGKMHTDLLDGKKWAVNEGYTDPERVGILGASYGAYAALVALTFTPEEFRCGLAASGPSNLVTLLKTIPPYWSKSEWHRRVGHPEQDREFLISRSPLFKVDSIKAPLQITHGANDPRVPLAESEQIVEALRRNKKEVEYLVYEDEGHGITKAPNVLHLFGRMEVFLARYLGGRVEPPTEVKGHTNVPK